MLFIVVALCIFAVTFCGCSKKATYVKDSFQITSVQSTGNQTFVKYKYQISTPRGGEYHIRFRADCGDRFTIFEPELSVYNEGIKDGSGSFYIYGASDLDASDIKVRVLGVWESGDYTDDTAYFAIAVAFAVLSVAALAAGITLFVIGNKKKHGIKCDGAENVKKCGEDKPAEVETDVQGEYNGEE